MSFFTKTNTVHSQVFSKLYTIAHIYLDSNQSEMSKVEQMCKSSKSMLIIMLNK